MRASVGDRIVTAAGGGGGAVRDGAGVELRHEDGSPPYLVEWADTGERTLVYPGSDSYVEHVPGAETGDGTDTTPGGPGLGPRAAAQARTPAAAVPVAATPEPVRTAGRARRDPHDRDVPLIGDEIAVGRALRRLADRLLDDAESDIASSTGAPAHVHQ